jgi:hypothetical protein
MGVEHNVIAEAAVFRANLRQNTGANPIRLFREYLQLTAIEFACLVYASAGTVGSWESGAPKSVPPVVLALVDRALGPGSVKEFQEAWERHLASLTEEVKRKIEDRYYPCGSAYGLPNVE